MCCKDPPVVKLNWCPSHDVYKPSATPFAAVPVGFTHFPLRVCFRYPLSRVNSSLKNRVCTILLKLKTTDLHVLVCAFSKSFPITLMSRIERKYYLIQYFILTELCVLVTFYHWGHFVMLIIRNLSFGFSVQSWTYLPFRSSLSFSFLSMFFHFIACTVIGVNLLAFYHECRSLIGYTTHCISNNYCTSARWIWGDR